MKILSWYKSDGSFWFRLFGFGLSIQDRSKHAALFSERNGHKKVLRAEKWAVSFLGLLLITACNHPTAPNPCHVHENQNDTVIVKDCGVKAGKLGQP